MKSVWVPVSPCNATLCLAWSASARRRFLEPTLDLVAGQALATGRKLHRVPVSDGDLDSALRRMEESIQRDDTVAWNVIHHVWGPLALFKVCFRLDDDICFDLALAFLIADAERPNCVVRDVGGKLMIVLTDDVPRGRPLRHSLAGKGCFDALLPVSEREVELWLLKRPGGIKCAS